MKFEENIETKILRTRKPVILTEKKFEGIQPHALYPLIDTILEPGETKEILTTLKVDSEDKAVTFFVINEKPKESNNFIETYHNWIGVGEQITITKINHSKERILIKKDEVAGKIIPISSYLGDWEEVDALDITPRGEGGFGSTGLN